MSIKANTRQIRADLEAVPNDSVTISRAELTDLIDRVEDFERWYADLQAVLAGPPRKEQR